MASNKEDNLNEGIPEHRGLDAAGRAAALSRLEPRKPVVGGSLADLQRMGADAVADGDDEGPFQLNPNQDPDVDHPADADAKAGLITVETDRAGISEDIEKDNAALADELQTASASRDNKGKERESVDPTSTSPKAGK